MPDKTDKITLLEAADAVREDLEKQERRAAVDESLREIGSLQ